MTSSAEKIMRDPVYGNIAVPWPFLLKLVDCPEFQRLRNIRQLGMCFTTFHGAEHSRFQHALGVMWLMYRVLDLWERQGLASFTLAERQSACAAALLHDIGHGPFSHALERTFSRVEHEALGRQIVHRRLAPILEAHQLDPSLITSIMDGSYPQRVLCELLASQLDVDRMDYLQRDSLYTGVKYGLFDLERILHTLIPMQLEDGPVLAVDRKGVQAVEEFLFSRYFMHWQVYLHRTVRSAEMMLRLVLERARLVFSENSSEVPVNLRFLFARQSDEAAFLDGFLEIDDFDFFHAIKVWRQCSDKVLADLAQRFVNRRLFKVIPHPDSEEQFQEIQQIVADRFGDDWSFYLRRDQPGNSSFGVYRPDSGEPIRALVRPPRRWKEISEMTHTDAILSLANKSAGECLLIAPECRQEALAVISPSLEITSAG